MSQDHFRYDLLVQDALRDVVRRILMHVAKEGFPGEHHAYVSFRTDVPHVRISERVKQEYPEEITIVLQHQFWDLKVTDVAFEVGLSFSNIPERLYIPFEAVTGFYDPSVQFGLKFEVQDLRPEVGANDEQTSAPMPSGDILPLKKKGSHLKEVPKEEEEISAAPVLEETASSPPTPPPPEDSKVIPIDAFRKKP